MTPKEKAKELISKFDALDTNTNMIDFFHNSKQCALIAVEEAKNACTYVEAPTWVPEEQGCSYWNQVQQEIENL